MVDGKSLFDSLVAGVAQNGRSMQNIADGKQNDVIGGILARYARAAAASRPPPRTC